MSKQQCHEYEARTTAAEAGGSTNFKKLCVELQRTMDRGQDADGDADGAVLGVRNYMCAEESASAQQLFQDQLRVQPKDKGQQKQSHLSHVIRI
jgi:hypothetical protein